MSQLSYERAEVCPWPQL